MDLVHYSSVYGSCFLFNKGNFFELNYVLHMLAQLSFSVKVSQDLALNSELLKSLDELKFFENKMANDSMENNNDFL